MTTPTTAPDALSLPEATARVILERDFGLAPRALTAMPSELGTVFRVELADGRTCAFKAMLYSESAQAIFGWQVDAMERLQQHGVPAGATYRPHGDGRVAVADLTGLEFATAHAGSSGAAPRALVHVGEWLRGTPLEHAAATEPVMRAVGATVAGVMHTLADHPAPPAPFGHPWELVNTLRSLEHSLPAIADPDARDLVQRVADRFAAHVQPRFAAMPHAVVHQDLHDSNLLIDEDRAIVSGVLDFGDMVWGPRFADLAVAAGYGVRGAADPAAAYLQIIDGWAATAARLGLRLTDDERAALFDASLGRLAVNLAIWTARADSDRGDYARARSASSARALRALLDADAARMREELERRLG